MLSLFKERPTPRRRLLIYAVVFAIGFALGELFGSHWRGNFVLLAAVVLETAWWRSRLRNNPSTRVRPPTQWVRSENVVDWVVGALFLFVYAVEVLGSVRDGAPDFAPPLLLLAGFVVIAGLLQHVVGPRETPKPRPLSF